MRRCRSRPTAGAERDLAAGDVRPCRPHRLERHQVQGARLLDRARWKQICGSWQRRAPGALNLTSWHVVLPASDEPTETDGEALGSEVVGETDGETVGAEVVGEGRSTSVTSVRCSRCVSPATPMLLPILTPL